MFLHRGFFCYSWSPVIGWMADVVLTTLGIWTGYASKARRKAKCGHPCWWDEAEPSPGVITNVSVQPLS